MNASNPKTIFPWHQRQWQYYQQCRQENRFAHAWLFAGLSGMGKLSLAKRIAQSRLCVQPDEIMQACGHCRHCQLFVAGNHPDFSLLQPEHLHGPIKIEQVRDLHSILLQTSQFNGERIVIIEPAEAMNNAAMNALLKLLEEPPKRCCLILITHHSHLVSATIRSRCQWMYFPPSYTETTQQWLKGRVGAINTELLLSLSAGSPLNALALSQEEEWQLRQHLFEDMVALLQRKKCPIELAKNYADKSIFILMDYFLSWLNDILQLKNNISDQKICNFDFKNILAELAKTCKQDKIYTLLSKVLTNKHLILEKLNINLQLLLESLFIQWSTIGE